ncbi:type 2 lanthipeptide synthetase LanM family protein [Haladaptatus cibarius]|uniref:type 2 lanthipeptide synthetase LanM family protein n=1 Tax=Haladaptatus cibarius TaxID=453847 RepID=UPI00067994EA|nr:type 2 lanthipeptide synthetase LanM family protein [Haladaptatus cibarius]
MSSAFGNEEKRVIAGRARTLHERLSGPANESGETAPLEPEELLSVWEGKLGGKEQFRQRFVDAEYSASQCATAAAATRWPEDEPLPEWIETLDGLVADVRETSPEARRRAVEAYPAHPFTHLFAVVVEIAKEHLVTDLNVENVDSAAIDTMAEWLHERFSSRFTRIFYVEFKAFVASQDKELAAANPDAFEEPPTDYYETFVGSLLDGDLTDMCLNYPVFARLLTRQVRRWREIIREVAERVRTDREALSKSFGGDTLGKVADLRPLADDTHQDGRAVVQVTFEGGTRIVYKPRSVRTGQVFYSILERLNDDFSVPAFECPSFISRDTYGWMEWIEYEECPDESAVERYYERAGALIATAYAFEFTDCHFENVVVHGSQPVLVDGETFMHPHVGSKRGEFADHVESFLSDSVLLTSMVPWSIETDDDERRPDLSVMSGVGNGSDSVRISVYRGPRVEATNTDVMSISMEHPVIDRRENTPRVDGTEQPPDEYTDAIVRGFTDAYGTLQSLHEDGRLLDEVVDVEEIRNVENRLVYRATQQYMRVVESLCSRDCLRDGARYSVEIDQLAGSFFGDDGYPEREFPVYEAERTALERLDPPRLTCTLDGDDLTFDGSSLGITASESGFERAKRRLDSLCESDRREQMHILEACFGQHALSERGTVAESAADTTPSTEQTLLELSADVFDHVVDAAADSEEGGYSWLWVESKQNEPSGQLRLPDTSLDTGRPGIAIAAAGLYAQTGESRFKTTAEKTIAPLANLVSDDEIPVERGGAQGVGGLLYGFSVLAELLDDEKMRVCARRIADAIGAESPNGDGSNCIADGVAGTLLALVAGYERLGDDQMYEAAVARGDYLLEQYRGTSSGRAWTSEQSEPATEFAYALSRLSAVTGERRFVETANEIVTAANDTTDDRLSGSEFRRWFPAETTFERPSGASEWRLTASEGSDIEETLHANDALRGGNFGRVTLLLESARYGNEAFEDARTSATACASRAAETGEFALPGHSPELVNPTLFDGLAGVSYGLLRASNPTEIPCVLRLE